jgi:hypothetical protein
MSRSPYGLRRRGQVAVTAVLATAMACQVESRPGEPQVPEPSLDAAALDLRSDGRVGGPNVTTGVESGEGGVADAAAMSSPSDAGGPLQGVDSGPATGGVFVAVGYAGRRVRSRDLGVTWEDDQTLGGGGDDEYLLRGVTHGRGVFVAVGWKILTSPDGKAWTERSNPSRQWLGGVGYGNDRFAAVGGYGYSATSADGIAWIRASSRGTEAARSLAVGGGKFIGATDPGNWWSSTDGQAWQRGEGGHSSRVVWCGDGFTDAAACAGPAGRNNGRSAFGAGVWVSVRGATIERSTDGGSTWKVMKSGGPSLEAVAFGAVP